MSRAAADEAFLSAAQRSRVLELVQQRFGIRDSEYAAARIDAAVQDVLPTTDCATVDELLASLPDLSTPRWLFDLVQPLTVGETYFMRDPAQVAALRETVLPDIIARRRTEQRLRVWSAGCSTGEEVYSLAILLAETNLCWTWDVTLVGTDVNRGSLRVARDARYPAWSFRSTPEAIRQRYFDHLGHEWQLCESVRGMARFAWLNLGSDLLMQPVMDADLVVCRNVTIYFDATATQRLYRTLVTALAPGGWLILGPSDPLPADTTRLDRVEVAETVLWRRRSLARPERLKSDSSGVGTLAIRPPRRLSKVQPSRTIPGPGKELEAGLLALEAGSAGSALEWLRRATFRQPDSALAQFALARAYVALGDPTRAAAALGYTRRLLADVPGDHLVPGSDSLTAETLRQAVASYLTKLPT